MSLFSIFIAWDWPHLCTGANKELQTDLGSQCNTLNRWQFGSVGRHVYMELNLIFWWHIYLGSNGGERLKGREGGGERERQARREGWVGREWERREREREARLWRSHWGWIREGVPNVIYCWDSWWLSKGRYLLPMSLNVIPIYTVCLKIAVSGTLLKVNYTLNFAMVTSY